ncbi:hypothetical protein P171DRAFT_508696, partial [Karstenula rhodostoma CBS 690.94]
STLPSKQYHFPPPCSTPQYDFPNRTLKNGQCSFSCRPLPRNLAILQRPIVPVVEAAGGRSRGHCNPYHGSESANQRPSHGVHDGRRGGAVDVRTPQTAPSKTLSVIPTVSKNRRHSVCLCAAVSLVERITSPTLYILHQDLHSNLFQTGPAQQGRLSCVAQRHCTLAVPGPETGRGVFDKDGDIWKVTMERV